MTGGILLFGRLKGAFGADRLPFPEGEGLRSAADLRVRLAQLHPDQAGLIGSRAVRIAVNQELAADEAGTPVSPSDEIALLPPLSGG